MPPTSEGFDPSALLSLSEGHPCTAHRQGRRYRADEPPNEAAAVVTSVVSQGSNVDHTTLVRVLCDLPHAVDDLGRVDGVQADQLIECIFKPIPARVGSRR